MEKFNRLSDLLKEDLAGKRVLLRADLNVPMKGGKVSDATRIEGVIPTIAQLVEKEAKVILISHFGRPEGKYDSSYSLSSIVDDISSYLENYTDKKIEVRFGLDCIGSAAHNAIEETPSGAVVILENLRFHKEEEENDKKFSKELASLADYYVNDAFSCSHRAHASISGVAELLPSYAGLLLEQEVDCLEKLLNTPERPFAAIVGGSKISTKIDLLYSLVESADYIFIGGGMANTFLYAQGIDVGASLCEKDLKKKALDILKKAENGGKKILLPVDAVIASSIHDGRNTKVVNINKIPDGMMALDCGTQTVVEWNDIISKCKTLIWNGPLGAIEFPPFDNASVALARSVAYHTENGSLRSFSGGGDTVALLSMSGVRDSFTYISTAGGAFLEWLEGKKLPGIKSLIDSASSNAKKVA